MYLSILIFPLLASFVSGFLGRKIGFTGAHILTCTCLTISSILTTIAFYEVGICGSPVSVFLFSWVESIIKLIYKINYGRGDSNTLALLLPPLIITLVNLNN